MKTVKIEVSRAFAAGYLARHQELCPESIAFRSLDEFLKAFNRELKERLTPLLDDIVQRLQTGETLIEIL